METKSPSKNGVVCKVRMINDFKSHKDSFHKNQYR